MGDAARIIGCSYRWLLILLALIGASGRSCSMIRRTSIARLHSPQPQPASLCDRSERQKLAVPHVFRSRPAAPYSFFPIHIVVVVAHIFTAPDASNNVMSSCRLCKRKGENNINKNTTSTQPITLFPADRTSHGNTETRAREKHGVQQFALPASLLPSGE